VPAFVLKKTSAKPISIFYFQCNYNQNITVLYEPNLFIVTLSYFRISARRLPAYSPPVINWNNSGLWNRTADYLYKRWTFDHETA